MYTQVYSSSLLPRLWGHTYQGYSGCDLDEGFQVESLQARTALKTAFLVLEWCREQDNQEKLYSFSHIPVVRLKACFASKHNTQERPQNFVSVHTPSVTCLLPWGQPEHQQSSGAKYSETLTGRWVICAC